MKALLKALLRRTMTDRSYARIMSVRSRNHQIRYLQSTGDSELTRKLVQAYGTSVQGGPFYGLLYPEEALWNRLAAPRLLGSYEQELHSVFNSPGSSYELCLDIGAAEGYYAVGLARTKPVKVVAYETDPRERYFCEQMARLNEVSDRVELRSWCDEEELVMRCRERRCFVLSDCEGYEHELFTERAIEALRRSDVLIELHDRRGIDMLEVMRNRFRLTHRLQVFGVEARSADQYPECRILGKDAERALVDQRSPDQRWLYCMAA